MNEAAWQDAQMHQRALSSALDQVWGALQRSLAPEKVVPDQRRAFAFSSSDRPSALDVLCATFSLSPFERDILLWCAGVELEARFAALNETPTFSRAFPAFPDAHWSALAPHAPLRYWRLIEVGSGPALTRSPLRIDERILHYLTGLRETDDRLTGWIEPLSATADLLPAHQAVADRVAAIWQRAKAASATPIIQLRDGDLNTQCAIAAAICRSVDLEAYTLIDQPLPPTAAELTALVRLWDRESALSHSALTVKVDHHDDHDAAQFTRLHYLITHTHSPLIIVGTAQQLTTQRPLMQIDIPPLTGDEQHALWQQALGPAAPRLNGQLDRLVAQFRLSPTQIRTATTDAQQHARIPDNLGAALWAACLRQTRPQLDDLAQRLEPRAAWDDLVLPERSKQALHEITAHVRQRDTVYETWGFQARSLNGLGVTALFAGDSGTGKTMAAEVLANELHLDLYRIDLSQIVNKYIGETEKNLRRVFDAAETGGAILLFDEADALFGKRSEVKDSHDRYANIEVSYLLQRMEAYRGLAILTTNMKNALDQAFLRRLRFVVHFPFPDARQRAEIWRHIFPAATPTVQLLPDRLARLNVSGGSIRNIALHAAFLAADTREPVQMAHLLQAARTEYAKLEKPLTDAEVKDWIMTSDE